MLRMPKVWMLPIAATLLLAACQRPAVLAAPSDSTPTAPAGAARATEAEGGAAATPAAAAPGTYAGWYLQRAGKGRFQPCGREAQWAVGQGADLAARAREFGLMDDTPVYVRVTGELHDGVLDVSSVEQFGSPKPVRDCPMTGVVIQ